MAEGITALFCMGFLAGTIIAILTIGTIALFKNENSESEQNEQRVD